MTEGTIAQAIAKYYGLRSLILVNNCCCMLSPYGEADLLHVTNSGYLEEIEIKITVADFNCEFVKDSKHYKHQGMEHDADNMVRRYYVALPKSVFDKVESMIPNYAGVFVVYDKSLSVEKVRTAKDFKQARRLSIEQIMSITSMACSRLWSLKVKGVSGRK